MMISVTISVVVDMCSRGDSLTPGPVGCFMCQLAQNAASLHAFRKDYACPVWRVFGVN
ncbi:hypothetical protein ACMYSK_25590 [Klebsiella sp. I138]|uniref:hypothetical protein n=1 Tax=Klebsiella sp. I138 TaxID=2755385 RepID=UPI003DA993A0